MVVANNAKLSLCLLPSPVWLEGPDWRGSPEGASKIDCKPVRELVHGLYAQEWLFIQLQRVHELIVLKGWPCRRQTILYKVSRRFERSGLVYGSTDWFRCAELRSTTTRAEIYRCRGRWDVQDRQNLSCLFLGSQQHGDATLDGATATCWMNIVNAINHSLAATLHSTSVWISAPLSRRLRHFTS